jgi:hypothetical protein
VWNTDTIPRFEGIGTSWIQSCCFLIFHCSDLWLDVDVKRESCCEVEVDAVAADILNRHQIGGLLLNVPWIFQFFKIAICEA